MRKGGMTTCMLLMMSLAGYAGPTFSRPSKEPFSPPWPEKTILSSPDTSGETWRQTGVLHTAYRTADASIKKRFLLKGCTLEKTVTVCAKPGQRQQLTLWRWENDKFLVMLSEAAAGRTDLAWGIIPPEKRKLPLKNSLVTLNKK